MDEPVLISDWIPRSAVIDVSQQLQPAALRPPRSQAEVDRDWERIGGRREVAVTRFHYFNLVAPPGAGREGAAGAE